MNDCPANTYRALRVIEPTRRGNLLYVELTMVQDWWFEDINYRELYDLDAVCANCSNAPSRIRARFPSGALIFVPFEIRIRFNCKTSITRRAQR